ncbi:NAD(P)-dependent oxidoreductase [uncultured Xylophilus sp.]|uniref:NAD(P)-dependent oxidoreductase n=1 Tax=uncultured Xylophilus sp. TaxID=296832 RepID=UPI0025D056CE|nr:NAD(P)-dependent oxidoreductase [uncultured Xylophilus sp.]
MHRAQTFEAHGNRVGFIGLGLLGLPMARRLATRGFAVVGWNREADRCDALAAAGGSRAQSPADVAEQCDIICLCVLDHVAVDAVVFGPEGVAHAHSRRPRLVLDFSTLAPEQSRDIAKRALAHGIEWIDAPVSGGPAAAETGGLTIMAGGSADALESVQPILAALATRSTRVGDVGSGQVMKAINQALVGGTFVLLAEALALTRELGLDAALVPTSLAGGMADSQALQRAWPRMASEDFVPPTGRAAQLLKDLGHVESLRRSIPLNLPVVEAATAQYSRFVQSGHGDDETVSIVRLYATRPGG